jgi:hypothetical protein
MLEAGLIISLCILFIHSTTWDTHIFNGIRRLIPEDKWYAKPLYDCPICMSPYWGSAIYLTAVGWINLTSFLLTIGATCGFSVLWVLAIELKDHLKGVKEEIEEEGGV